MPVHSSIHFLWTAGVLREGGVVRTALIRLFCIPLLHLDIRAFARSQTFLDQGLRSVETDPLVCAGRKTVPLILTILAPSPTLQ